MCENNVWRPATPTMSAQISAPGLWRGSADHRIAGTATPTMSSTAGTALQTTAEGQGAWAPCGSATDFYGTPLKRAYCRLRCAIAGRESAWSSHRRSAPRSTPPLVLRGPLRPKQILAQGKGGEQGGALAGIKPERPHDRAP